MFLKKRTNDSSRALIALFAGTAGLLAAHGCWDANDPDHSDQDAAESRPHSTSAPAAPPTAEPRLDHDELLDDGEEQLRSSLDDVEPRVRVAACRVLKEIADPDWVDTLRERLARDPDAAVRGCAAVALGLLADEESAPTLHDLYEDAEPMLRVSYAEALYRLGTNKARVWLERFATQEDLEVAFQAALVLADISPPRHRTTTRALRDLARREAELRDIAPFAGMVLLTKLARLGHRQARQELYEHLEAPDERIRIAAAEGLARLGDDAGKAVLLAVVNDGQSPNRVYAARLLVLLGSYHGEELLGESLASSDAAIRRAAARGLGDMGAKDHLRALLALYEDSDHTVRVAAAAAVLFILGLEPRVLAQASVDWARSAIDAEDWTVRHAAARSLGDIPEQKALPLLAQAVVDPEPRVRRAAAHSAARMKTAEAAERVAAALELESDPDVQEEQVRALGHIGKAEAKDALEGVAGGDRRVGVLAFGSLIAVGDVAYAPRLDTAYERGPVPIRLAAMEAAVLADNPVTVPVLEKGVDDAVSEVRFRAAEGLAHYGVSSRRAVDIFKARLADAPAPAVQGRALKGLLQLDIQPPASLSIADLAAAPEPEVQRAVLPVLEVMDFEEAAPLLRLAGASADPEVRSRAVEVISEHAEDEANEEAAGRLLKNMLKDDDPLTRAKAKAQFAKIAPPLAPPADESTSAARGPVDLTEVQSRMAAVEAAEAEFKALHEEFDQVVGEIARRTGKRATSEAEIDAVDALGDKVIELHKELLAAHGRVAEEADKTAEAAAGLHAEEAGELVARARALAEESAAVALSAGSQAEQAAGATRRYLKAETAKCELYLTAAEAAIPAGRIAAAGRDLRKAETVCRSKSMTGARLQFLFGWYHDTAANNARSKRVRLRNLRRAKVRYERFVEVGTGYRLDQAKERLAEIAEEMAGDTAE